MQPFHRRILIALAVIGVPVFLLFQFVYELWTIPSDDPLLSVSILPQLEKGDVLVVSREKGSPRVGKTVRCSDPEQPRRFVIGRLVAARGGIVQVRAETVLINGEREAALGACEKPNWPTENPLSGRIDELRCWREPFKGSTIEVLFSSETRVPDVEAHVDSDRGYLVSDNRHQHLDSRDFGAVDLTTCSDVLFRVSGESIAGKFSVIW